MSASTIPTFTPRRRRATARLAARVDLPTPPLPLPTAIERHRLFLGGHRDADFAHARLRAQPGAEPVFERFAVFGRQPRHVENDGEKARIVEQSEPRRAPVAKLGCGGGQAGDIGALFGHVRAQIGMIWPVCQPFSRAPPVNRARRPYKSLMNDKIDGSMGRRSPRGLRQFFHQISQMANSPWGSGPGKGEDDGGKGSGGDGKKPGPRNPWVTPDPADQRRGQKPRGPSALDELLRKGRGGFGGGGSGGGGGEFEPAPNRRDSGNGACSPPWSSGSSFRRSGSSAKDRRVS